MCLKIFFIFVTVGVLRRDFNSFFRKYGGLCVFFVILVVGKEVGILLGLKFIISFVGFLFRL